MKKKTVLDQEYETFNALEKQLRSLPLLAQGSVFCTPPSPDAPRARPRYIWTRKVKAKTITKSLTKEQYDHLQAAIEANKKVEQILGKIRSISQKSILNNLPSPPKRKRRKTS